MKLLKKIFKFLFFVFLLFFILGFSLYGYSRVSTKLEIKNANNISLYDGNGNLFFMGNGTSEWISLEKISIDLINATISTEDKNFYDHFGFDFLRILKACWVNITSGSTKQGASTISQQYVKNLFLDFDKTWERKWNELWLTLNMEIYYSKDEILEGYLNTINYGHGMYGIENASKFYFNKSASDLSLAEASLLVGIPKSPANYSPIVNYELSKSRQKMVLSSMVKNGYITEDEMNMAYNQELVIVGKKSNINLSTIMYYQDAVLKELENLDNIPTSFLDTGGLKIYTSLDLNAQVILEEKIEKNLKGSEEIQANAIMMNPNTGAIIALVGGRDYAKSQYNRATSSYRQVGSVMKPILYYSALENGFTASTCFTSEETTFTFSNNQNYSPRNASEIYGNKPISLAAAIAYSDNVYAVKTHIFLGEDSLVNMANRLGINSNMQAVPSLALGTSEINIIELTSAFATFANEGYKIKPHLITKIEDRNGNVLYQVDDVKESILNPSLVYILNNLLTSTYDASFVDYNYPTVLGIANKLSRKYAIKSGTTATDSWTVGYTPEVITSIWIGYDDSSNIATSDYMYTKNIFADSMEAYFKDKESTWYNMPNNVVGVLVDPISGLPVNDSSKKKKVLYYLKGTEPTNDQVVFDEIDTKKTP
ncbi:MAG: PBP1A family penicillin-binding protein [Bacilli bacterium]|nr:PBP1A family penicillin-binding protein [Bacilli bacterium]